MVIDIKNRDVSGREGVLDIEGIKIKTPNYLPNQKDIDGLVKSPFVNDSNFPNVDIGVYVHWLDLQKITSISGKAEKYNQSKYYLKSKLKDMEIVGVKRKLLHFELGSDVPTLSEQQLSVLFNLQNDVGADIIEVPNLFPINEYEHVLDIANEWRHSEDVKKDLMGIANEGFDIAMLKDKTNIVDCIGVNLKKENPPLLFAIKNYLKQEDIWIHAFSVPRSFRAVGWNGTLTVLLNNYGIDTISTKVGHPKGSRNYRFTFEGMTEEQKIKELQKSRYFNPTDYSTLRFKDIISDLKLSKFCNCPVCQGNSISTLLENTDTVNANIRSHEVFAYMNESGNYQAEIKQKVSNAYFNSKRYAKEIESRLRVQRNN